MKTSKQRTLLLVLVFLTFLNVFVCAEPLGTDLTAYWRMEESNWSGSTADVIDTSLGNHTGTAIGGVQPTSGGILGKAGSFDGIDDLINTGVIDFDDTITLSAWIKPNDVIAKHYALGRYYGAYHLGVHNSLYRLSVMVNDQVKMVLLPGAVANVWTHLAVSYDGAKVRYYVNGEEKSSTAITGSLTKTDYPWQIGADGSNGNFFDGLIDEAAIWNRALNADEINELYNSGAAKIVIPNQTPLTKKLYGYWRMENSLWNGTADEVVDLSDNNWHGQTQGGTAISANGKLGRGGEFDGVDDCVNLGVNDFDYPITFGAWIKPDNVMTSSYALGRYYSGYHLGVQNNQYRLGLMVGGQVKMVLLPGAVAGEWAYLAVSYDGTNVRFYVNGEEKSSTPASGSLTQTSFPWQIGASGNNGNFFDGTIDEVCIWNKALAGSEIERLYNSGSGLNIFAETNVVRDLYTKLNAYWKMNRMDWSGSVDEVDDYSGNAYHGQAVDGAETVDNGLFDRAGSFDGTDDYVQLPKIKFNYPISYSTWIKPNQVINKSYALGRYYGGYHLGVHNNYYRLSLMIDNQVEMVLITGAQANQWTHLAVVYDGSNAKYYINGSEVGSVPKTGYLSRNETYSWQIGANGSNGCFFDGLIDEVAIWHRSLSPYEISKMYNNGIGLEIIGDENINQEVDILEPQFCDPFYGLKERCYLNGSWRLLKIDGSENHTLSTEETQAGYYQSAYDDLDWEIVQVPQDISADTTEEEPGTAYYRRYFNVPATWSGNRVLLYFEAIAWAPTVWVNGQQIAQLTTLAPEKVSERHQIDITDAVQFGSRNQITVRLYRHAKTDRLSTGIYGPVMLKVVPQIYNTDMTLSPSLPNQVRITGDLTNTQSTATTASLSVEISPKSDSSQVTTYNLGSAVLQPGANAIDFSLSVQNPVLWDVYNPYLYDLKFLVNGNVTGWKRFGLREFTVSGQHFELNGNKLYLPGISFSEGHLFVCLNRSDLFLYNHNGFLRKYLELLRQNNCLVIYRQENIASDIMNTICDELGLLQIPTPDLFAEQELSIAAKEMIIKDTEAIPDNWISGFPVWPNVNYSDPGSVISNVIDDNGVDLYIETAMLRNIKALTNHPSVVAITPEGEANRQCGLTMLFPDYDTLLNNNAPSLLFSSTQTFPAQGRPLDGTWVNLIPPPPFDFLNFAGVCFGGAVMDVVPYTMFQELADWCSWNWGNQYYSQSLPIVATESLYYNSTQKELLYWQEYIDEFSNIVLPDGSIDKTEYANVLGNASSSGWWSGRSNINIAGVRNCLSKSSLHEAVGARVRRMIEQARIADEKIQGFGSVCGPMFSYDSDINRLYDLDPDTLQDNDSIANGFKAGAAPCMVCAPPPGMGKFHLLAGESLSLQLYCFNNFFEDIANVQLRVKVLDSANLTIDEQVLTMSTLSASSKQVISYTWTPAISIQTGDYTLKLELEESSLAIAENEYDLYVLSTNDQTQSLGIQQDVYLYGAGSEADQLAGLLQGWNVNLVRIQDLQNLQNIDYLIIAPGCLDSLIVQNGSALQSWLQGGGILLCMEQNQQIQIPWANDMNLNPLSVPISIPTPPVGTELELIENNHIVFSGINKRSHWAFWNSLYGEVYNCMLYPLSENVIASGRELTKKEEPMPFGMVLAERTIGSGHCVFSQANAMKACSAGDAVALKYLRNLISYFAGL